jgi:hypothetical protein
MSKRQAVQGSVERIVEQKGDSGIDESTESPFTVPGTHNVLYS